MVNKQIQTEINDLKLKDTRIQLNRSLDKTQLNSIENRNLIDLNNNNEFIQIKKIKLNDDLKYYDFLDTSKELELDNHSKELFVDGHNGQLNGSVLSNYLSNCQTQQHDETNENQYLNSSINTSTNLEDNVLIDEFENSIEINDLNNLITSTTKNQQTNSQLNDHTFNQSTNLQFNDPFLPLPYNHQFTNTNESNSTNLNNLNNLTTNTNQSSTKLLLTNHNSPSQFIKLDQENDEQIKCDDQLNNSTFNHSLSLNNTNAMNLTLDDKRLLSSQKINGEDLLFSFANDDLNDVANNLFATTIANNFNYSPSLDSINSGDSMFCSSVWGSSPNSNSSNNSSLNNDLDLPFILNSDSTDLSSSNQPSDQNFLDSEFPFLMSEDSIFNSFLNSNLSDLINTDEFFNEKCTLNDDLQIDNNLNSFLNYSNTFNSSFNDNHCSLNNFNQNRLFRKNFTLSKDSNLAKLLKEKLPIKLPSQSNQTLNNGNSNENCSKLVDNQINNKQNQNNQINLKTTTTTTIKTEPVIKPINNIVNTTNQIDLKKNGLITRKLQGFTIQGLNVDGKNLSTGCLARSIKIIDPMNVNGNSNNVKYLLNNISTTANSNNNQTTSTTNCFSLNLTPANCITVTNSLNPTSLTINNQSALSTSTATTSTTNQLSTNQTPQTATLQSNTTTKSFIIKSVDGKFANGILYTPISSRNGTNIAYTSNLTATNITNCTTNGLLINNRKLVQKRPYSSMSVSISNQNLNNAQPTTATGTKDFYSIDLVPNTINTVNSTISSNLTIDNNELETKKKLKTLDTSTDRSNYAGKLPTNSVLLNLLVKGEDISNGYLKSDYTYKRCNQSIYNKSQQSTRIR